MAKGDDKAEFEQWLRTVCFQAPTAEAYDLAREAWQHVSAELAAEREKSQRKQRQCEFYSVQCNAALERAERAEAACAESRHAAAPLLSVLALRETRWARRAESDEDTVLPDEMDVKVSAGELRALRLAVSTDASRAYAERVERYRADSERLAFVFSLSRHDAKALIGIEMRLLNDDEPTMDEVRNAIDAAMASAKALQAAAKAEEE